jgi:hypothetical protein
MEYSDLDKISELGSIRYQKRIDNLGKIQSLLKENFRRTSAGAGKRG